MASAMVGNLKWTVMGMAVGAFLSVAVGVKSGWILSKDHADQLANAAVLKTKVGICVAQFINGPRYPERMKELKALNFIQRDGYIEKGGWDKMPGEEKASDAVNRVCGDKLAEQAEEKKGDEKPAEVKK